jgi:hypothetical protein
MTGSLQQAAAAIVALINSKPTSPSEAEIAEILGRVGKGTAAGLPMSPEHAEHYAEWRRLIEVHMREFDGKDPPSHAEILALEARLGEHMDAINALADRIHATPARTWGDVVLYAEVCFWSHWPGTDPEGANAQAAMAAGPASMGSIHDVDLAKLIEAVFTVAGIRRPCP